MGQRPEQILLRRLLTEMAQTEQSAFEHPRREAKRFAPGDPPAIAMLDVSNHAQSALVDMQGLGGDRSFGTTLGSTLSAFRNCILDRFTSREKSYRGTLLGLQHGIDCAVLTQAAAIACERTDVADFCKWWLEERRPLVAACQESVTWFADHPDEAMQTAPAS